MAKGVGRGVHRISRINGIMLVSLYALVNNSGDGVFS